MKVVQKYISGIYDYLTVDPVRHQIRNAYLHTDLHNNENFMVKKIQYDDQTKKVRKYLTDLSTSVTSLEQLSYECISIIDKEKEKENRLEKYNKGRE